MIVLLAPRFYRMAVVLRQNAMLCVTLSADFDYPAPGAMRFISGGRRVAARQLDRNYCNAPRVQPRSSADNPRHFVTNLAQVEAALVPPCRPATRSERLSMPRVARFQRLDAPDARVSRLPKRAQIVVEIGRAAR